MLEVLSCKDYYFVWWQTAARVSDYSGAPRWINSISSWDIGFLLYFWGHVFIISAGSGGPWCVSQSGDLLPLKCCEIEEEWDGSPADLRTSDTLGLGWSLLLGNLINGVRGLTTWMTLLADSILLLIMTPRPYSLMTWKHFIKCRSSGLVERAWASELDRSEFEYRLHLSLADFEQGV